MNDLNITKKAGVMVYFGGTLDFCDVQILFA